MALKLGCLLLPRSWKTRDSDVETTAPELARRASATVRSKSRCDETASAHTWTSMPSSRRSSVVWSTQTWVSRPQRIADVQPSFFRCALTSSVHMEKSVFSKTFPPAGSSSDAISGTVFLKALGYCSVTTTGMPSSPADLTTKPLHFTRLSKPMMTSRNRSWMSQTSTAVVAGLSFLTFVIIDAMGEDTTARVVDDGGGCGHDGGGGGEASPVATLWQSRPQLRAWRPPRRPQPTRQSPRRSAKRSTQARSLR
mmetsp:Transcript_6315/g.20011  ORF Transcript_6315/g.20011 Transcript_6315/m.20011 type:complete len:253 (+) Transcript_6315:101-859(+)